MHSNGDIYRVWKSIPKPEWRNKGPQWTAEIENVELQHLWELPSRVDYWEKSLTSQHKIAAQ
jgi:hypothetical protein